MSFYVQLVALSMWGGAAVAIISYAQLVGARWEGVAGMAGLGLGLAVGVALGKYIWSIGVGLRRGTAGAHNATFMILVIHLLLLVVAPPVGLIGAASLVALNINSSRRFFARRRNYDLELEEFGQRIVPIDISRQK